MTYAVCDAFEPAVSVIQKCGSQSIRMAVTSMRGGKIITNEDALKRDIRVMFIRDPLERLQSCFSHFSWLEFNGADYYDILPKGILSGIDNTESDYQKFIDYILENNECHWSSQVKQMTESGVFTPTVVHKFEEIQEHWEKYAVGKLPWENAWSKLPISDYRHDDVIMHYADDYNLRGSM